MQDILANHQMSFVPIVDKKQLKDLIAAGEVDKQTRQLNGERALARDIGYVRDAATQRRLQQPTLQAIAESTAQAIEDAKITRRVIESASEAARASTEHAISGLVKEIKASANAAPIAEIEARAPPVVIQAPGPLTAKEFKTKIAGDRGVSGTTFTHGDLTSYFGNHGATIAISDAGNMKRVFLQRLRLQGEKQIPGDIDDEIVDVEVSPAMAEFISAKTKDNYSGFDRKEFSREDTAAFWKIRKFANYIGDSDRDPGASTDGKWKFLMGNGLGNGLGDVYPNVSSHLGDFYIDPEHWQKGKLRVRVKRGDGFADVLKGNLDHSFVKLMSERFNPKYEYSGNGIELYRKFVHVTGAPVAKTSGKYKLVFGPKNDVDQLGLYMASMAAGNKSTETYNKAVELADKLYKLGLPDGLDKESHARLTETLARLIAQ